VSLEDIQAARGVVEVVSVQNRFNLWERKDEKNGVLEVIDKFKSLLACARSLSSKCLCDVYNHPFLRTRVRCVCCVSWIRSAIGKTSAVYFAI
jgi:aryl-alcohol dehydrogenase-like predicted oxidoreductase